MGKNISVLQHKDGLYMDNVPKPDIIREQDIVDLCDNFDGYKTALNALGELLANSTMEGFSGDTKYSRELREGLQQIITFVVDHQERDLDDLLKRARNSR